MNNSRTKNSTRNITFSIVNKLITLVLAFVSRKIFIYCLSVEYLGIQGLFSDILTMLSFADLGFGTAMTFSMYKPLAENDTKRLVALTSFYKKVYGVIVIVIATVGCALIPFLKFLVKTQTEIPNLEIYYVLYLLNTIASYLVVYKTSVISADQKEYVITKYTSIFTILCTISECVFLLLTRNFVVYLIIRAVFTLSKNLYVSKKAEKMYPYINEKGELSKEEKKGIVNLIGSGFIYKIVGVVLSGTDNILISVIVGTVAVGYYSNYMIVSNQLTGFVNIIFYSITASLGNLVVQESKKKCYDVFNVIQSTSMIISAFCTICLLFLQEDLISVWLGEKFVLDVMVLIAIAVNLYFTIILYPIRVYRDATGLYQKTKFVMLVTAVLNIVLSIVLGNIMGLAGILFATSISKMLTFFWYEPIVLFKEHFDKSSIHYFVSILKNLIVIGVISVVEYLVCTQITVTGWFSLILKSAVVGIIALVGVLLFYFKSQGIKLLLSKIKARG